MPNFTSCMTIAAVSHATCVWPTALQNGVASKYPAVLKQEHEHEHKLHDRCRSHRKTFWGSQVRNPNKLLQSWSLGFRTPRFPLAMLPVHSDCRSSSQLIVTVSSLIRAGEPCTGIEDLLLSRYCFKLMSCSTYLRFHFCHRCPIFEDCL